MISNKIKKLNDKHTTLKIKQWDYLLIASMLTAPMTSLRIWKVGPAEILCLIWGLRFFRKNIKDSALFRFFIGFLTLMTIGTFIGVAISPDETDPYGLLTWIYFAIVSLNLYEGLSHNSIEYNERILILFTRIASILYTFLCFYGIYIHKTFCGLQLWYANTRFSGGATNPHQIALLLSILIMFSLRDIAKHGDIFFDVLCIAGCIYTLSKTDSSTAIMATVVGFIFWISSVVLQKTKNKLHVFTAIVLLYLTIIVLFYSKIFNFIYDWILSDPNGLGRFRIFSSYPITFWKSPLFGLGPGTHALNGIIEYHNTYLEILAATGIVGFLIFVIFSIWLFMKIIKNDILYVGSIAACYIYGFSGFGMRRLVYWITMVFVITICNQKEGIIKSIDE